MNEQNAMKPYVIGLDLGGTNSVFGIVDARGEIKATTAIKTGNYPTAEAYVDACMEALPVIIDQVGGIEKIKAMGIGAPNGNYYREPWSSLPTSRGRRTAWCPWHRCSATDWVASPWP